MIMVRSLRLGATLAALLCICVPTAFGQTCDRNVGPAGLNACVNLSPTYNDYQWATCLSNVYIRQVSGYRHACTLSTSTFCWYQCMLEKYDSEGPSVLGECRCNPSVGTTSSSVITSTLPSECYSPDGSNCNWYTDCLEKKYSCQGTSAGYAVEYGIKFCGLYGQNLAKFSTLGQQWVNSVRRCLQVCLVPLLRQYTSPTCEDIRSTAFASHRPCYLGMGCHMTSSPGSDSICNLQLSDIIQVANTMWRAVADPTTMAESVCGALDVGRDCGKRWISTRPCIRTFVALAATAGGGLLARLAPGRIGAAIALATRLTSANVGLSVLGCQVPNTNQNLVSLSVSVADEVAECVKNLESPGGNRKRRATSAVDFDAVVERLESAVLNGSLMLVVDGEAVYIRAIGECDLMNCSANTALNVTAPWPPIVPWPIISTTTPRPSTSTKGGASSHSHSPMLLLLIGIWVVARVFVTACEK